MRRRVPGPQPSASDLQPPASGPQSPAPGPQSPAPGLRPPVSGPRPPAPSRAPAASFVLLTLALGVFSGKGPSAPARERLQRHKQRFLSTPEPCGPDLALPLTARVLVCKTGMVRAGPPSGSAGALGPL